MSIFSGNAVAQLIFQSDMVSKSVLIILFCLSIICWSVFLQRFMLLRLKNKQVLLAYKALAHVTTVEQLTLTIETLKDTFPGQFLLQAHQLLQDRLREKVFFTPEEKDILSQQFFSIFDTIIKKESSYLSLFTATAEVSTLLGLFGTIWGLIHSFIRISERQSADIITVAPGIAEALITTLAGLLVAIPTIALYHALAHSVNQVENNLLNVVDRYDIIAIRIWERDNTYARTKISPTETSECATGKLNATY